MTDVYDAAKRSQVMGRVKSRDTAPEMRVRKLLTAMGVGYRLHRKDLPGHPDIVMAGRRLAIFVHGCFWHGHDCARGARVPKQNRDYWQTKIGRNAARDLRNQTELQALGWRTLILWECGLKDEAALRPRLSAALAVGRR